MEATESLGNSVGIQSACEALMINRSAFYRWRARHKAPLSRTSRPLPPLTLMKEERQEVLGLLDSERFMDQSPHVVYTTLLD